VNVLCKFKINIKKKIALIFLQLTLAEKNRIKNVGCVTPEVVITKQNTNLCEKR
jgi:hypothetical protein